VRYEHIDALFRETIDWDLIETHWQDLLQVVLSIQAGKMLPSTILRRLGTYSRKNRLHQAFRELGCVVRTVFHLQYISNLELRHQIQRETNKVEGYNGFTTWLHFDGYGVIAENDPEAQDKHIKYLDLLANAVLLQNVADMSAMLPELAREGYRVTTETIVVLSPYITRHIKRFGDYIIDRRRRPALFDGTLPDWLNLRSA
jgi:TnpA family transposase